MSLEIDGRPIPSRAFEDMQALMKFVGDMKTYGKRLEHIAAREAQADEREAAAEKAEGAAKQAQAEAERAKAALADERLELHTEKQLVAGQRRGLYDIQRDIGEHGDRVKREALRYSGLIENFNERLQSLPNWDALARIVLGQPDAHMDGNEGSAREQGSGVTEAPDNLVGGSTLTRSIPRPPKPTRADMRRGA